MAGRDKFADAVARRFSGGSTATAEPDADDAPEDETGKADAENGRMLAAAIKRGDGAAICEAVRRISGG